MAAKKESYDDKEVMLPEEQYTSAYDIEPKEVPALAQVDSVFDIVSPLVSQDNTDGLRPRRGWHQTWKRSDEFREAIDFGYRQIRKQKIGAKQEAGSETGPVIVKADVANSDVIAMEIPIEVYDRHILALSSKSHMLYNDPDVVMKNFSNATGRDLSSRKEQVSVKSDIEPQREVLHKG